jgi:hypothetical protein
MGSSGRRRPSSTPAPANAVAATGPLGGRRVVSVGTAPRASATRCEQSAAPTSPTEAAVSRAATPSPEAGALESAGIGPRRRWLAAAAMEAMAAMPIASTMKRRL